MECSGGSCSLKARLGDIFGSCVLVLLSASHPKSNCDLPEGRAHVLRLPLGDFQYLLHRGLEDRMNSHTGSM